MKNTNERIYLCIDLKSFFASVECVDRGLDPFSVNLVVADPDRGDGTVCLAVTPAMKALGVPSRCRVFEIPNDIKYIKAPPRMKLYMQKSKEVYSVYLRYISPEDIHPYSVDECFIDITNYFLLYKKSPREMARFLIDEVYKATGLTSCAGVGTNLFLAKVALDIMAKKSPDLIGYLDIDEFKSHIWHHMPITDIWNIGSGTAKRLEKFGVYDLFGVSLMNESILYKEFGVNAEFLINHSLGIENCTIKDIKSYVKKSTSISSGQVLFRDYSFDEARVILREMVDSLSYELVSKKMVTERISLSVSYSRNIIPPINVSSKLSGATSSCKRLTEYFDMLYLKSANRKKPIRKISVCFGDLIDECYEAIDLFTDITSIEKEKRLMQTIIGIRNRYGKNSLLKGINFLDCATTRERNQLLGGHKG